MMFIKRPCQNSHDTSYRATRLEPDRYFEKPPGAWLLKNDLS